MFLSRRLALGAAAAAFLARPLAASDAILIFAAASLRQGLDAALAGWHGAPVVVSYAGTATLARQIEAGAPADLFFAANAEWATYLADRELFDAMPRPVLGNALVLAGRREAVSPAEIEGALAALPADARIATGFTEAVPVGIYARQVLEALELWDVYGPRIVQTENARVAAALAARGELARALIYATDVLADPLIATEAEIASHLHDQITYPLAICARGPHPERGDLADYLAGEAAFAAFQTHGFLRGPQ